LVVANPLLRRPRGFSEFFVWANVEKCVSHIDEDTGLNAAARIGDCRYA
jgi:hypothetical protein